MEKLVDQILQTHLRNTMSNQESLTYANFPPWAMSDSPLQVIARYHMALMNNNSPQGTIHKANNEATRYFLLLKAATYDQ